MRKIWLLVGLASLVYFLSGFGGRGLYAAEEKTAKLWEGECGAGYSQTNGNAKKSSLNVNAGLHRKTGHDEFNIKANMLYSSSSHEVDGQKWYAMGRYGISIWNKKWYNFYKVEADHDRFANINYRIIPSTGLGYWFSDTPDWKAMVEMGIGLTHTDYRDNTKTSSEATLIPRVFLDKRIFGESHLSEDITFYSSLKNSGEYRFRSATSFTNPINERLSLRISFIDDYNSEPSVDTKKNDTQIVSSLNYSF